MSDIIYLSKEGYENLKSELNRLKNKERPKIINQISEARDKGDLSENAEYDAAKEAQGLLEARIAKLESDIANSRILNEGNSPDNIYPSVKGDPSSPRTGTSQILPPH